VTATAILDLERDGFTREQVEALARWHEAGIDLSHLATKADLATTKADLELKIAEVRADLRVLEHRMTIKLGGMIGAAVVLIGAFLKLFPGGHP
jgi:hypothetical protein